MPKMSKQARETTKTVVIAVLVTAIVAFIAGTQYQESNSSKVQAAVIQATSKK